MDSVTKNYIDVRATRGDEAKPFIAGTRISVQDIYVWHELRGSTPDDIVANFPHLTLAQVHSALSYFFDHAEEILAQLAVEREFADGMEASQGLTKYTQLREKLSDKEDYGDSLSSG